MEKKTEKKEKGRRITFRLSEKEWQQLDALLKESTCRSISSLIRKAVFGGRIMIVTYDRSLDKVMEELSSIREEIRSIGVNINQVTRKLHQSPSSEARLFAVMEITKLYQQTEQKVSELLVLVANLSRRWLPE